VGRHETERHTPVSGDESAIQQRLGPNDEGPPPRDREELSLLSSEHRRIEVREGIALQRAPEIRDRRITFA
jgi:hypothetical protein